MRYSVVAILLFSSGPVSFLVALVAGLLAQIQESGMDQATLYSVVTAGILGGFTAVWVKIWQLHSDWKADKNNTIAEQKEALKEKEKRNTSLLKSIEELRDEIAEHKSACKDKDERIAQLLKQLDELQGQHA